jgi:hypothetical protein
MTWRNMVRRCRNPNAKDYDRYGGAGVTVCDEWLGFLRFYADMGTMPGPDFTIERVNNSLGYERANCRWATDHEQRRNKRCNVFIEAFGRRMIASDWAREVGLHKNTILWRLRHGRSQEEAVTP